MAEIQDGGKGRKVSPELNLVPFIDLMSVLITFLLITAVWTQISMIQIGTSIYGKQTENSPAQPPPHADVVLRVDILERGYLLWYGKRKIPIRKSAGEYDNEQLLNYLAQIKQDYPDKVDAVIQVQDELPFDTMIQGMDVLLEGGFPNISIATGDP